MSNETCIPCQYNQFIQNEKKIFLQNTAKFRAVETNTYMAIVWDAEDNKFIIQAWEQAKKYGLESEVADIISPYQRLAT